MWQGDDLCSSTTCRGRGWPWSDMSQNTSGNISILKITISQILSEVIEFLLSFTNSLSSVNSSVGHPKKFGIFRL